VYEGLIDKVVGFRDDLVRNIKGIRETQDLFDDLATDAADRAVAISAETSSRIPSAAPLITRPFDYGTVITYPFVDFNWHATRFSDGLEYGVWYGSLELETTVYETVYHWHRFVMDSFAGEDREIIGERRVFTVHCDAILIDLRGKERRERRLIDKRDYAFTQGIGRFLRAQGQNGLLVKSARSSGTNAVIFNSRVLSDVRDLCLLTYQMNPTKDRVVVRRTRGKQWLAVIPSGL
jgi:RES domain